MENEIAEKLEQLKEKIQQTAKASGQKDVTLIAVSKLQSVEKILQAAAAGAVNFGENYVQELCGKIPQVPYDVHWHLIGPLQKNKVKYIVGRGIMVQSVDRLSIAQELNRQSINKGCVTQVLLQVNTCGEETKSGVSPQDLRALFDETAALEGLQVRGLMTIGPNTQDQDAIARCFEETRRLFEQLQAAAPHPDQFQVLSMGMSHDYELAIRSGANMVRIGSLLFGARSVKT